MIIVGELINASRKLVREAIENQDGAAIQEIAARQAENGADYIDVNAGIFADKEPQYLKWLVRVVQEVVNLPCCLDSPDPKALKAAMDVHRGVPMINSISMEKHRRDNILPLVIGSPAKIVALCMSDSGIPRTAEDRVRIAGDLIESLTRNGMAVDNIFVDPLVQPLSVDSCFGVEFLDAVAMIHKSFAGIHTICGVSNVSFGLPNRLFLNRTFMSMAIARGLDGAILDPLDRNIMASVTAAEMLIGKDEYCLGYLSAFRAGRLGD